MFFWQKIAALSIRVHGSSDILCCLFWNTGFSPFEGSSFWQMDPVHLALLSARLFQNVQVAFSVPLIYSLVPWDESSLPLISLVLSPALPVLCSDHIFPVFFISLSCSFDLAALCSLFFKLSLHSSFSAILWSVFLTHFWFLFLSSLCSHLPHSLGKAFLPSPFLCMNVPLFLGYYQQETSCLFCPLLNIPHFFRVFNLHAGSPTWLSSSTIYFRRGLDSFFYLIAS